MVRFLFEKWVTDDELDEFSLHLIEVEGECPALKLPVLYAGVVHGSELKNPNNLSLKKVDYDYYLGVFLSEFHSDPVEWEDWNDEYFKYYPILKCPISGEEMEARIVRTINRTQEYKALQEEVDALTVAWNKEDSIQKKHELDVQRREIWNKMEEMSEDKGYQYEEE